MNLKRKVRPVLRWHPSIRTYLVLMNVVVLCFLFPTISIYYYQKTSEFRDEQLQRAVSDRKGALKNKVDQLVRSVSHSGTQAISGYNFTFLNDLIKKAVTNDHVFIGCQFAPRRSPEIAAAGVGFSAAETKEYKELIRQSGSKGFLFEQLANEEDQLPVVHIEAGKFLENDLNSILIVIAPVYVGGELWGTVSASFAQEYLDREIGEIRDEWAVQMHNYKVSFLSITLSFLVVGIASAHILTKPLLKSIYRLREGVDLVSGGKLGHKIVLSDIACDEFMVLSRSFNDMTDNLRIAREQLDSYSRSLEEKVAERTKELHDAQAELLAQAHEAGMAEMAVGVLHNIGNAITPIKIGTTVLIKRLRTSPLRTTLKGVLKLVPDAIQKASAIPENEKVRLATIFKLLPDSIREEYDQIIDEIEHIREKNKYIEKIINLQMRYANLKKSEEPVEVNRVVMDALDMISDLLVKHEIKVITSLQDTEPAYLEESKLLQILVNLIKNGCEAMSEKKGKARELHITTSQDEKTSELILTVRDTGCGFTPEEKEKMFSFGYSTKNRGTGFGLHSSANYLIANNGSIEARSDGPEMGAEFVIHLPRKETKA